MSKLVLGCGYLGSRVVHRWRTADEEVHVVTRSSDHARRLRDEGCRAIVADVTEPNTLDNLPAAETVLYAVGHDPASGESKQELYVSGLAAVIDALPEAIGRLIYISSTGVFGQSDGSWVDEASPCEPQRESARAILAAEQLLRGSRFASRSIILRLAGIYGPGRIPRRGQFEAGEPISVEPEAWLNLIHVLDAAEVVLATERKGRSPGTYIVSDGNPLLRRAFYEELARLMDLPPPRFAETGASAASGGNGPSGKRVSNAKMRDELDVRLRYPSYREGLRMIVGGQ